MKIQMEEIHQIASNPAAATFDNTMVALEKSGRLFDRANRALDALTSANTNENLQHLQEELAPRLAAHSDAIYLNDTLFRKIDTLYKKRGELNLAPESKRLVEYFHDKFVMRGANLPDSAKQKLKKINEEEALLSTKFSNQLLAAAKAAALVVDSKDALIGLSEADIESAAQKARDNKHDGKFQIAIQNTTQQPALKDLSNRETRQKLFEASWTRAERGDSNDTRQNVLRLATIRVEKANLLGFPNYAAWKLQDQMAKTPANVESLLSKLVPAATAKARVEADEIRAFMKTQKDSFDLEPWDWNYYAEKLRKSKFDLDENEIKPYFVADSVLQNGVFYAANKLYGISFKPRKDIPVYHPDVKVFEVFDHDGSGMALLYIDFYKRDNKNGGAWMNNFVDQSKLLGTKPVIVNVFNYPQPAKGQPALISYDDVSTMFHEFGHTLHGLFANQEYPTLSGTSVARDFVEMPSQFNEHWALDSTVLINYAKHYQTGKVMPQSLIDKIKNAASFNQGYAFTEILAASELDMQWHTLNARDSAVHDVDTFEKAALERTGTNLSYVPPRYRSSYFLHIWSNGYSAGYYAYTWAEMLDNDAYAWFRENGGLTRENGQRFRDMILSKGNTEDLATMYRNFRGKEPDIKYLLESRGLVAK
jgi:peptidyl-dipeptidase Dcp